MRRCAIEEISQVEPVDCQRAPSARVTRIYLRRLSEILDRLAKTGFRNAKVIEIALLPRVVGLEAPTRGPIALRRMLARQKLYFESRRHSVRDLILQRKEVPVGSIVALRPLSAPVSNVDELGAHSNHVSRLPHAPLEQMRYSKLRPDAAAVLLGISELKRRTAPDHLQPRKLGERRDQIFRDPVGKVLLARISTLVCERQHRYGRPGWDAGLRSVKPLEPEIPDCQYHHRDGRIYHSRPPAD